MKALKHVHCEIIDNEEPYRSEVPKLPRFGLQAKLRKSPANLREAIEDFE